jgi:hypothetical protein
MYVGRLSTTLLLFMFRSILLFSFPYIVSKKLELKTLYNLLHSVTYRITPHFLIRHNIFLVARQVCQDRQPVISLQVSDA